jgi:CO/xanthine dehydrogenase Mo-binding subunit
VEGRNLVTVEGLDRHSHHAARLKAAFLRHGAAQCGICTPGMLVAATALLERGPATTEKDVMDAIGGVLCRCTGYRKIIGAVLDAGSEHPVRSFPEAGRAVGSRLIRLDGERKVDGTEIFGADEWPHDALIARLVRCPHHHAHFSFGDLDAYVAAHAGVAAVFTAKDVPGFNCFGVIPAFADQPVFADGEARFRGEAVAMIVGDQDAIESLNLAEFPVAWKELPAYLTMEDALCAEASLLHESRPDNVLVRGRVARGDVEQALAGADVIAEGIFETGFVEHAYVEPEAGFARRVGDRIEIQACTQSPYMDRSDIAAILGLSPENVRIIPTALGGGFGSKLDLSIQPFIAIAAWHLNRPVRIVYSRPESIIATTKRHPSRIQVKAGATSEGKLAGLDFFAEFNTGAYSSWGPTVAHRVPVHASGPYYVPHYRAETSAVHTHLVPSGAFRGFGVPQAAIAQEQIYDELANKLGIDPLEFRIANALSANQSTVTGHVLDESVGIRDCLEALRTHWERARAAAHAFNSERHGPMRRGVGVAGIWYGCGNTSLPNPSTIRVGLKRDGRLALHQGAVDIGQGSNTIIAQICADALGAPIARFDIVSGDTDLTPDCGKTSASRQTFVSGKAALQAGEKLRETILDLARGSSSAMIEFHEGWVKIVDHDRVRCLSLAELPLDAYGYVLTAESTFDPPTTPLDADGQGIPYAVYGFGAQMVEVEVDCDLGTVKALKITGAFDVGRAINPTLIEGQIEGGAAQGLGFALMEEFLPGSGENLHDYLIPTAGDMPVVESILIENGSAVGPYGAKGIGEHAVIPTAPAILNAIHHATGARIRRIPATPDRVRAAIIASQRVDQ